MMLTLFLTNIFFVQAAPVPPTINGSYLRPCYIVDTDALTTRMTIQDSKWTLTHTAFEDENCKTPYLIYEIQYKTKTESNAIDMTTVEASYTSLSDEVARSLNYIGYCGFGDWKKGVKKVVTGKMCDEYQAPASGDITYSIFTLKNDGKELFVGTASGNADGRTPESRYDQVDPLPLIKQ